MPRRASLIVFLGLVVALVFVTGISAGADEGVRSKEAEIVAAQDRLMEIRVNVSTAQAAYDNALFEMNHLNGKIAKTKDDLDAARERLAEAQEDLEERASQVYRSGNVAFMDVLVGVDSFSEFATRLDLWMRLLGQERAEFEAVQAAKNELAAYKTELEVRREKRIEAVEEAVAQKERATEAETRAEAYLNSLNADLRAAIQAEQDRQVELARAAVAATAPEPAPGPAPVQADEPEPIPQVQVSQVEQAPVPQPDLEDEEAAAERAAATRAAAEEAQRLAEERAAERAAAREAERQAAAEAAAAVEAARLAAADEAREEAREEAARAAELAAERAAEREAAREKA
ncbi:MAG: coiled-coil domain-containing protein, partial [Rubrobacter sp.]